MVTKQTYSPPQTEEFWLELNNVLLKASSEKYKLNDDDTVNW